MIELYDIKSNVITINKFCSEVKMRKLKIFCFILFIIILVNYLLIIKFSPFQKFKMIKERVKSILQKINKISEGGAKQKLKTELNDDLIAKNDQSIKEDFHKFMEKKNN